MQSEMTSIIYLPMKDRKIIDLIFKHGGYIFGGYIRDIIAGDIIAGDIIAGVSPNDMDVAIDIERVQGFYVDLYENGYKNVDGSFSKFKHPNLISVDVVENDEEDHKSHIIGVSVDIDFDVNCLAYDGKTLFLWTGSDMNPMEIVDSIRKRRATVIKPDEKRIKKMQNKGYTII